MKRLNAHIQTALRVAAALAVVWAAAALWRPTATYHLAPILIAGAAPFLSRGSRRAALPMAVIGGGLAIVVALLLAGLDLLQGPSLLPVGGALLEAVVFAGLGAGGGFVAATANPAAV